MVPLQYNVPSPQTTQGNLGFVDVRAMSWQKTRPSLGVNEPGPKKIKS